MKFNTFIALLLYTSFYLCSLESRFRGAGRGRPPKSTMRKTGKPLSRPKSQRFGQKPQGKNNYQHGGNNNRRTQNNFNSMGNSSNWASAGLGWGLIGGMGMGMLIGGSLAGQNKNVTVINQYDNSSTPHSSIKQNINYNEIVKSLQDNLKNIESLSSTLASELKEMNATNTISSFIKINFKPYEKISVLSTSSKQAYGDESKEKVQIPLFQGNQDINKIILNLRDTTGALLQKLANSDDQKQNYNHIKTKLTISLKILNENLVAIINQLQK